MNDLLFQFLNYNIKIMCEFNLKQKLIPKLKHVIKSNYFLFIWRVNNEQTQLEPKEAGF